MTKEFQKGIYNRSRLKNKMDKYPTEKKNITAYKRQRNLCVSLRRKNIKSFLNNVSKRGIITNKNLGFHQAISNKQRIFREQKYYT